MRDKVLIIVALICIFTACDKRESIVQGDWVVDQAYYNNVPVIWDLYSNGFNLKRNGTCYLPISDYSHRDTERQAGLWELINKNNRVYLQINTTNFIFNRTFAIHNLRKVQDTVSWGYLMKMTLISDSLRLDCTKAL